MCELCLYVNIIISVLATLASIAALVGVYKAHVLSTGLAFGTTSGSLSLLALAITLFLLKKALDNCSCQISGASKK